MANKKIGPTFSAELSIAGLMGMPFSWGEDGTFSFDPQMRPKDIDAVLKVYNEHDPEAEVTE